jgi:hypothetical protein
MSSIFYGQKSEYLVLRDFGLNAKYPGDNVQDHDQNADKNANIFGHFLEFRALLEMILEERSCISNFPRFLVEEKQSQACRSITYILQERLAVFVG